VSAIQGSGGAAPEHADMPAAFRADEAVSAIADPVVIFGPEVRIAWTNASFEARLGFDRSDLLGKTPDYIVMPSEQPFRLTERIRDVIVTGVPARVGISLRTSDDASVPFSLALGCLDDGRGWHGAIVVAHEVTAGGPGEEYEQAYAAEHRTAERLRALDEMKNVFLSALSHELRTPVTAILGLARTLEREYDRLTTEEIGEFMRRISSKAAKLDRILNDLLDLDRLRLGMTEPIRRKGNIADLIRHVIDELDIAQRARITLDVEDVLIAVDQPQAERIVENLVVNALTHTPSDTPVWVRTRHEDGGVLIIVEDAGPGIPAHMRSTIFEPFTQAGVAAYAPGVGIGLSLVSRFADIHGGRAWVEERPGGGASFRVFLPSGPARN
jgi:signal transduction histidine kinase